MPAFYIFKSLSEFNYDEFNFIMLPYLTSELSGQFLSQYHNTGLGRYIPHPVMILPPPMKTAKNLVSLAILIAISVAILEF